MIKELIQAAFRGIGLDLRLFKNANVEQQILRKLLRVVRAGTILDVGANAGQFGDTARAAGFAGTLVSFEALPEAHSRLLERARRSRHPWIVAPCAAIGAAAGEIDIHVAANSVSSSLLPMLSRHLDAAPQSRYVSAHRVPLRRLDEFCKLVPPDDSLFIKIDTQGYEMEVLKGATALLPRTVALEVELSIVPLYEGAPGYMDMLIYFSQLGFELFGIVPEFTDQATGRLLQVDGFFIRRDQLA
jgi:FkbM family methyltransferase